MFVLVRVLVKRGHLVIFGHLCNTSYLLDTASSSGAATALPLISWKKNWPKKKTAKKKN
jgi:hypothetical protein